MGADAMKWIVNKLFAVLLYSAAFYWLWKMKRDENGKVTL